MPVLALSHVIDLLALSYALDLLPLIALIVSLGIRVSLLIVKAQVVVIPEALPHGRSRSCPGDGGARQVVLHSPP